MKTITSIFCFVFAAILIMSSSAAAQLVYQPSSTQNINGSITAGDVSQAGRLTRDGKPSTCSGDDAATVENNNTLKRDSLNLSNPFNEEVCVKVEIDFTGCNANQTYSAAYSAYNPAQPGQNVIGDSGYSTINKGSYFFSVAPNASFTVVVHEVEQNTGCAFYNLKVTYLRNCRQPGFDKTNDGKADISIYRTSNISQWWTMDSQTNQPSVTNFGTVGDIITGAGDYTGDGQTDLSVYRPSESTWYYGTNQATPGTNFSATQWGATGDRSVPGDYDGDGKHDIATWRPSNGTFYVLRSSDGTSQTVNWGINNDRAVTGDFDGDTKTDFAVARATSGGLVWYILKSNYNYAFESAIQWGVSAGDRIVPADYDGDSITDMAVWREAQGIFYVRRSSDLTFEAFNWGSSGDRVQPADYDGDNKADYAVFRQSTGTWYIRNSSTETFRVVNFGLPTDVPVSAAYRVQ